MNILAEFMVSVQLYLLKDLEKNHINLHVVFLPFLPSTNVSENVESDLD